jgi:hypothetical protein
MLRLESGRHTWSPDGDRIACLSGNGNRIVVDFVVGKVSDIALGRAAIWPDRTTFLVEV